MNPIAEKSIKRIRKVIISDRNLVFATIPHTTFTIKFDKNKFKHLPSFTNSAKNVFIDENEEQLYPRSKAIILFLICS